MPRPFARRQLADRPNAHRNGRTVESVVRSLWIGRAWTGLPLAAFAVAAVGASPSRVSTVALLSVAAALAIACATTVRLARALERGDRGEILLKVGARVPVGVLRAAYRADLGELWTGVLVGAGIGGWLAVRDGVLPKALAVFGLSVVVLQGLVWVQRRWSNALFESLAAVIEGDLDRAERALAPAARSNVPSIREAADGIGAQILLRRGLAYAAQRQLEQGWNGTLDDRAAMLGWLQLGSGDPALAERWLAVPHPDRRYEQYLAALVGGALALHRRAWDDALARVVGPRDLPRWFVRELHLIEVAALQGAGRSEQARSRLATLGSLEPDRWLAAAAPVQWRLLEDAAAGRPTTALPTPVPPSPSPAGAPADPFAPPKAASRSPIRPQARWTGAIPVEGLPLCPTQRSGRGAIRLILGVILLAVGPMLIGVWLLLRGIGDEAAWTFEPLLGAVAFVLGGLVTAEQALARSRAPGNEPAVALSDGRLVGRTWFPAWGLTILGPLLGLTVTFVALLPLAVGEVADAPWVVVVTVPLAVLFLWSTASRLAALRVVRSVHFDRPAVAVVRAEWTAKRAIAHTAQIRVWLALARLWAGDARGAEDLLQDIAAFQPQLAGLRIWFQAARGEVDLDRALAEPEPEALGDRYRWGVAVALAALRAGQAERVRGRVAGWTRIAEQVPNRFGGLLLHLAARVEGRAVHPPDPDLAWINEVWPFVNGERT